MADNYNCKKPSVKGMAHMGYLGHFAQDKFIEQGHNDVTKRPYGVLRGRDSEMEQSLREYGRKQQEARASGGEQTEAEKTAETNRKQREAEARYRATLERRAREGK